MQVNPDSCSNVSDSVPFPKLYLPRLHRSKAICCSFTYEQKHMGHLHTIILARGGCPKIWFLIHNKSNVCAHDLMKDSTFSILMPQGTPRFVNAC